MTFHFVPEKPDALLSPYVKYYFYLKGDVHQKYNKILPDGSVILVINLGGPHTAGKSALREDNQLFQYGWFQGVQTSPIYHVPFDRTHMIGVVFEPLGFFQLFGWDLSRWTDRVEEIGKVFGHKMIKKLVQQIIRSKKLRSKFDALDQWMLYKAFSRYPVSDCLEKGYKRILKSNGCISLSELYQSLRVSSHRFGHFFISRVGLSPNAFCRILRLRTLLAELSPSDRSLSSGLAQHHGFTDQAKFNQEFKHFCGLSLSDYLQTYQQDVALNMEESVQTIPQV